MARYPGPGSPARCKIPCPTWDRYHMEPVPFKRLRPFRPGRCPSLRCSAPSAQSFGNRFAHPRPQTRPHIRGTGRDEQDSQDRTSDSAKSCGTGLHEVRPQFFRAARLLSSCSAAQLPRYKSTPLARYSGAMNWTDKEQATPAGSHRQAQPLQSGASSETLSMAKSSCRHNCFIVVRPCRHSLLFNLTNTSKIVKPRIRNSSQAKIATGS